MGVLLNNIDEACLVPDPGDVVIAFEKAPQILA